jgi:hypothetical protein
MYSVTWMARTSIEKAKARRLIKSDKAKIINRVHENYIGKHGLVNYEAWEIEERIEDAINPSR